MQTDPTKTDSNILQPGPSSESASKICIENGDDPLASGIERITITDDARSKLKGWLNRKLKIIITDQRLVEGTFICTDRDGNIILENTWEYTDYIDDKSDARGIGLSMVPGKHIKSIWLSHD